MEQYSNEKSASPLGKAEKKSLGDRLLMAAGEGKLDLVTSLLEQGAPVNFRPKKSPMLAMYSPLCRAVSAASFARKKRPGTKYVKTIKLLLEKGADPAPGLTCAAVLCEAKTCRIILEASGLNLLENTHITDDIFSRILSDPSGLNSALGDKFAHGFASQYQPVLDVLIKYGVSPPEGLKGSSPARRFLRRIIPFI